MTDSTAHNLNVIGKVVEELNVDHISKTFQRHKTRQCASLYDVSGKNKETLSGHSQFT